MNKRKATKRTGNANASLPLRTRGTGLANTLDASSSREAGLSIEQSNQKSSSGIRKTAVLIAIFALFALVAYAPAINGGYIWDDDKYVTTNPLVNSAGGLWGIWFQPRRSPQYYPLVFTSFWIEDHFWGLRPFGYHLVNVLLHMLNAFLVWRLCRRLCLSWAWLAAAVFLLHPVHVESVAWITERKNVLSGALYLGAAFTYLQFMVFEPGEKAATHRRRTYAISLVLFTGALLSKSVTATLPAALLLVVWWKRGRIDREDIAPLIPMFLIGAIFGLHTAYLEKYHVGAHGAAWDFTILDRFLIAGRVFWFYAAKLFWPYPLIFFYPRWHIDTSQIWQYLYPLGVILVIVLLWILRRRIGRGPVTGVLFFIGTLVPVSGFFDYYPMQFSFVADHFQYLASLGLIVLFSGALARLASLYAQLTGEPLLRALGIGLLLVLGCLTRHQSSNYTSDDTLWQRTLAMNDQAFVAHTNYGVLLERQGKYAEAISHYKRSLEIRQDNADAYGNLGLVHEKTGKILEAKNYFEQSLKFRSNDPDTFYNLGVVLEKLGKTGQARIAYENALHVAPAYAKAYSNLGILDAAQGDFKAASGNFKAALAADPEYAKAHFNFAVLLVKQGQAAEAENHFKQAIGIDPGYVKSYNSLGALLRSQGRDVEAESYRERARTLGDAPR